MVVLGGALLVVQLVQHLLQPGDELEAGALAPLARGELAQPRIAQRRALADLGVAAFEPAQSLAKHGDGDVRH